MALLLALGPQLTRFFHRRSSARYNFEPQTIGVDCMSSSGPIQSSSRRATPGERVTIPRDSQASDLDTSAARNTAKNTISHVVEHSDDRPRNPRASLKHKLDDSGHDLNQKPEKRRREAESVPSGSDSAASDRRAVPERLR